MLRTVGDISSYLYINKVCNIFAAQVKPTGKKTDGNAVSGAGSGACELTNQRLLRRGAFVSDWELGVAGASWLAHSLQ